MFASWRKTLLLGAALFAVSACRSSAEAERAGAPSAQSQASARSASSLAGREAAREQDSVADQGADLPSAQQQVLAMYEAMTAILEAEAGADCELLGASLETIVTRHTPHVKRWAKLTSQLSASEQAALRARFEASAGPRMKAAQEAIRRGIDRCNTNQRFMGVFSLLASLTPAG
jgi:hypothetical protein